MDKNKDQDQNKDLGQDQELPVGVDRVSVGLWLFPHRSPLTSSEP